MAEFEIPVVIFIFKRDKAVDVINRIREVRPKKLYILADHGRNDAEKAEALRCRNLVEQAITWDCLVIKNYAEENRGVYQNIAEGAKWVLRQEKWAIFLEYDNLPEVTFFQFCQEMLERYEKDTRVLWICGTNYLGEYHPADEVSYVFTRHMLPCGWASWSDKFERFYDGDLTLCKNQKVLSRIASVYCSRKVYRQYRDSWMGEYQRISRGERPTSWDYQMDFSIKANNLFGICPCRNQIRNIGVDNCSVHGGTTYANEMTRRFCGMLSYPVKFPMKHPVALLPDPEFEKIIGKIILYPWQLRAKIRLSRAIRCVIKVPKGKSIAQYIENGFK